MHNLIQATASSLFNRYAITVWVRLFGELLTSFTSSMIAPFLILYQHDKMGVSIPMTMAVVGLQPLSDIVANLLGGSLTDRIGRKPVLIASLALQMLAMVGMTFASAVWMFALLLIANGVGRCFYIPAERAQLADAVPESQRSEVFALLSTIGYLGVTTGPLFGLALYRYNPAISFGLVALAMFLYLVVMWWKVPETAPAKIPSATGEIAPTRSPLSRAQLQVLLGLMVATIPISLFHSQAETNFRLYLQSSFADSLTMLAWLSTVNGILMILTQLWLIKRTEKIAVHKLVFAAYCSYFVVALLYGFAHSFALLVLAQLFLVVGQSLGITRLLSFVSILAPPHLRGRYFALYGMHWDISRTLGPFLGGLVLVHAGGQVLFLLIAVLLLVGSLVQYRVIQGTRKATSS